MKPLAQCRLYTFVDTAYLRGRKAAAVAGQLCEGGSDLIQLRAKDCSPEEVRQLAGEIQPILRRANVGLVINDHWDIAREVGADFCHLGQQDFFGAGRTRVSQLATLDGRPLAGLSTHAPEEAARALAAQPAYIAIGPVFATGTKPRARPVTLEYVRWAAARVKIPWFAIGGINLRNLDEVLGAGAERICVLSAILNQADIARACGKFSMRIKASAASGPAGDQMEDGKG
ncbi:MAG: thiamine phosphate synthase [Verrucomicrobiota bacterium]